MQLDTSAIMVLFLFSLFQLCTIVLGQSTLSLSGEDKQQLLNRHNFIRSTVFPPAVNMERMVWDYGLAAKAKDIAANCTTNESMFNLEPGIGINSAHITSTSPINFTAVLSAFWESEGPPNGYDIYKNECNVMGSSCNSYKQMVFASANKLGCGLASCTSFYVGGVNNADSPSSLLICAYEGNITAEALDGPPYIIGDGCSVDLCPNETRCDLTGLCAIGLTDYNITVIVNGINTLRGMTDPPATNMLRLSWNEELANIAQSYSDNCSYDLNSERHNQANNFENVGETIFVVPSEEFDISSVIQSWFDERVYFEFDEVTGGTCNAQCHCDNYLQLVTAVSENVGCGITNCPKADGYNDEDVVLVVCNFGPGRDPDEPAYQTGGDPCTECPDGINVEDCEDNLCPTEKMMVGSDPHFSVLLPRGNILCYSVQGEPNLTFNLISNDVFEMNALFIPDEVTDNTWLGTIGISVLNNKNVIQLKFDAKEEIIQISKGIDIDAHTVKKLFFREGRLRILDAPKREYKKHPKVLVHLEDSGIKFSVTFTKSRHLDLSWHSSGQASRTTHGLIGQFFREGVSIDEKRSLLILPHKPPVQMKQRHVWKFMKREVEDDQLCWTTVEPAKQGENVIDGTYRDYVVEDVYSTEFRMKRQHLKEKFLR